MLGQPASWQTVCSPWFFTSEWSSVYSGPIFALILIQGGFFSMGVWLLRASIRSSLRPSGAMVTRTLPFLVPCGEVVVVPVGRRAPGSGGGRLRRGGRPGEVRRNPVAVAVVGRTELVGQVPLHGWQHLGHGHIAADLAGDAGDIPFVGRDAARDDPLEPREVIVAVEGESVHTHPAGDPAADRADLPLDQAPPGVGVQPHPGLAVDPP